MWRHWVQQPQKMWLRRALFQIHLWSGIGIIGAQRIGAGDLDGSARSVRAGFVVPTLCALALTAASILLAAPLLHSITGGGVPWQASGT